MEEYFNTTSSNLTESFHNDKTFSNHTMDNVNYDKSREIGRLVEVVARPIYVTFGTIGNLLSFYVMRRGSLKKVSTCFYMSILALADTGVLWSGGFVSWIAALTNGKVDPGVWTDCKFHYFMFFFCRHYSSALLCIVCIEKFIALYFPLKVRNICTVKTAKYVTFFTTLIFVAFNSQFFVISDVFTNTYGFKRCTFVSVPDGYMPIFYQLDTVIYSFGPFTIMCLVNSAIIYKFVKAKSQSGQNGTQSTNQALSKSATKGTAMLITVTVTFIILTGPESFVHVINHSTHPIAHATIHILLYLNHGINGVLYCIVGSRFREELLKVLCCKTNISSTNGMSTRVIDVSKSRTSSKYSTSTNNYKTTNTSITSKDSDANFNTTGAPVEMEQ